MKLLTAKKAQQIVNSISELTIEQILQQIRKKAENGETVLHIYEPINDKIRNKLNELGYDVPPSNNISIQRDNLYASIHWK